MFHTEPARFALITIAWLLFLARPGVSGVQKYLRNGMKHISGCADCVTAWVLDPQSWNHGEGTEGTPPKFLQCGTFTGCTQYNSATKEFSFAQTCISAAADGTTTLTFSRPSDPIYGLRVQEFRATADFCGVPEPGVVGEIDIECKEQPKNGGTKSTARIGTFGHVLNGSIPTPPKLISCKANDGQYLYEITVRFNRANFTLFNPEICTSLCFGSFCAM